jgi:predicted negative regulator of RcsB-dependent stress response
MTMRARKGLALFAAMVAACSPVEPKRPDPEGIVVLELPSASVAVPAAKPTANVVAAKPEALDLESCIAKVRQDPFPGRPADPSSGELYQAGLGAERRGDTDRARKLYFEMIQGFRTSPYQPLGYFAFGELFRADAASDPSKIQFAVQSYDEAIKYPADQNPLWEVALFRKAELAAMTGDGTQVMATLLKMKQTRGTPRCVEGLAEAIRTMLPPAYASSGKPDKAATFFASFGVDELTATATARLARLYITQQKKSDALAALRSLANSKVPGVAALCGEALTAAQELGDPGLVRDLGAKCVSFGRPSVER